MSGYNQFLARVKSRLSDALSAQPYDSLSNFITFAQEYKSSQYNNLPDFYRDYDPPLVSGRYTCVGLAADLASRLADLEPYYPGLKDTLYQVSCEEELTDNDIQEITSTDTPKAAQSFKEHVLLCVRVRVQERGGVVLLDPGYHVPKPITVMEDGLPPQTGIIQVATTRPEVQRWSRYFFHSNTKSYVVWEVEEEREGTGGKRNSITRSLIHVSKPFLSSIDVTERRNLAYAFKTLMGRDGSGAFMGGLYFAIKPPLPSSSSSSSSSSFTITFFHRVNGEMKFVKKSLSYFLPQKDGEEEEEEEEENIESRGKEEMEEDEDSSGEEEREEKMRDQEKRKISEEKRKTDEDKENNMEEKKEEEEEKEDNLNMEERKINEKNRKINQENISTDKEVEMAVSGVEAAVGRTNGDLHASLVTLADLLHDLTFLTDLLDLNGALEVFERAIKSQRAKDEP